ncbi:hypothetical protein TEQG_06358 [Trichophyton equinum CBS 127.97]|uniref:Uncharacterized protein n=1 Tax=Trichophyton equinum (strain ATCC MYA-4606 / CBS 127.97) TaxID=559882 RepID=F2PZQ5_TRIEC|nr:hypothetical protein TEQG_06358 [Trichophyton equinum CBS 127.97]
MSGFYNKGSAAADIVKEFGALPASSPLNEQADILEFEWPLDTFRPPKLKLKLPACRLTPGRCYFSFLDPLAPAGPPPAVDIAMNRKLKRKKKGALPSGNIFSGSLALRRSLRSRPRATKKGISKAKKDMASSVNRMRLSRFLGPPPSEIFIT